MVSSSIASERPRCGTFTVCGSVSLPEGHQSGWENREHQCHLYSREAMGRSLRFQRQPFEQPRQHLWPLLREDAEVADVGNISVRCLAKVMQRAFEGGSELWSIASARFVRPQFLIPGRNLDTRAYGRHLRFRRNCCVATIYRPWLMKSGGHFSCVFRT